MAFTMALLAIAAGVAWLLGVIGIYGVMSYVVSQRTAGDIVRQGGYVALTGIAAGGAVAAIGAPS